MADVASGKSEGIVMARGVAVFSPDGSVIAFSAQYEGSSLFQSSTSNAVTVNVS